MDSMGPSAAPYGFPCASHHLSESQHAFSVRVDVPGVKAADLNVALAGGLLVVSGARHLAAGPDGERFHRLERPGGSFRRSVALPTVATPEMAHTGVEDGVLTVVVPSSHGIARPSRSPSSPHGVRRVTRTPMCRDGGAARRRPRARGRYRPVAAETRGTSLDPGRRSEE